MLKKITSGLAIFFLFATVLTNTVSAGKYFAPFDEIYMTDAYESFTEITIFGLDKTPWLYLRLPENGLNFTGALWKSPTADRYLTASGGYDQDIWLSLGDYWDDVKEEGEWNIRAGYIRPSSPIAGFGSTSFTVTPEPVSSVLFLTGGATLVIRLWAKRKHRG